ncbi:MAG: response regulator transcription factor [Chloroflexi bacterium]|nr:MAG: response regulator transcription factor [Chloroflexota bacterium]
MGAVRSIVRSVQRPPDDLISSAKDSRLRVIIVQDHPLLASAIEGILEAEPDITVRGIAWKGGDAASLAAREKADVALLDFHLPDVSGPAAADMIQAALPSAAIVFHSGDESESDLLDAIDAGATAYLTKSAAGHQIVEVLIPAGLFAKAIARQRRADTAAAEHQKLVAQFTPRELQMLHLMAEALDVDLIAERLGIAPHTVEWHIRHVIEKLRVHSKLQAVIEAARRGLITL